MKISFSNYLDLEVLVLSFEGLNLKEEQKQHLIKLVDSSFHQLVFNEILSALTTSDKKIFLYHLSSNKKQDEVMEFLSVKIEDVDGRIRRISDEVIREFQKDIKEYQTV